MVEPSPEVRMSDVDALLWELERHDPRMRSTMTAVALLDRTPGAATLRRRVERLTRVAPRLRARVADPSRTPGSWRWEPDPDFDPAFHVRVVRAPAGAAAAPGGSPPPEVLPAALLGLVEPLVAEALDRSRPPWRMVLVEDLPGSAAALVVQLHHGFTDGMGAIGLAAELFALERDAAPGPMPPAPSWPGPPLAGALAATLAAEAGRTVGLLRAAAGAVGEDLRATVGDPAAAAAHRSSLARSMAGLGAPAARPLSPILTGRSSRSRLGVLDVPLEVLRRAGMAADATVNDAYLAAVLAGLRRYHGDHDSRPPSLRVAVPVSLRTRPGAGPAGNAVLPVRVEAPLQLDPVATMRAVHRLVHGRAQPGMLALDALAAAGVRSGWVRRAASASAAGVDAVVSNVPGADVALYLGAAEVRALVPFGPRTRAGLNVTALSHAGRMGIGVDVDPSAAPDHGALLASLRAGFADIAAVAETVPLAQRRRRSTMGT